MGSPWEGFLWGEVRSLTDRCSPGHCVDRCVHPRGSEDRRGRGGDATGGLGSGVSTEEFGFLLEVDSGKSNLAVAPSWAFQNLPLPGFSCLDIYVFV